MTHTISPSRFRASSFVVPPLGGKPLIETSVLIFSERAAA